MTAVVLASRSAARAALLAGAGVPFETADAGVDEAALKTALLADGSGPRDIADALAEAKAVKVSARRPGVLVIGADQTMDFEGVLFDKPETMQVARDRLRALRDKTHKLHSAVVVARDGEPIWRVVETASLTMRPFSDAYLDGYLSRVGPVLLSSVGAYQLEGEGAQLFSAVRGDYFTILGLPLFGLLDLLRRHEVLPHDHRRGQGRRRRRLARRPLPQPADPQRLDRALGLDAVYVPFAVAPERIAAFVEGCRGVLVGLNVTVPHKTAVLDFATGETSAVYAHAANVLEIYEDGRVVATNTDGVGLLAAFAEQAPSWDPAIGPVVVIGAGGAARGAVAALDDAGVPEVLVVARRAEAAIELAGMTWCDMRVSGHGFEEIATVSRDATAIINASSAGLKGEGTLPPMDAAPLGAVFMDMVYTPLRTPFLQAAAARGHLTVDGLAMLIGQARPSFQAFFGVAPPPAEVVDVRALCLKALGEA
jgi:septum formation protein